MREIQLPDGRTLRLTGNETPAQLSALKTKLREKYGGQEPKNKVSRLSALGATAGQGVTFGLGDELQAATAATYANLFGGVPWKEGYAEALGGAREDISAAREQYPIQSILSEIGGGVATGSALGKLAGAAAPRSMQALQNVARAHPIAAATAGGVGSGALYGFGTSEGGLRERLAGTGTGAVFGGLGGHVGGHVASKVAPVLGALGKILGGAVNAGADDVTRAASLTGDDIGTIAARQLDEAAPPATLGRLTAEQQKRSQTLAAAGIPKERQTVGMVTRDPKAWQYEQNVKGIEGVGDEIQQRYIAANSLIRGKLEELGMKTGGKAETAYRAGEAITDSVIEKSREMQKNIGKLYKSIGDEVGDDIGLRPSRLLAALDDAGDNAYADNLVSSMTRKMKRFGVIDENMAPTGEALSVKKAEELRKFANSLRGDKQTDHIVSNVIDALDDDVIETAGVDAFKGARDAARERFQEFFSKDMAKSRASMLQKMAEGSLVADKTMKTVVYGSDVKDLIKLKSSLLTGSDKQIARGTQAWSDLKLQALENIMDSATTANGKLQGSRFAKELKKIGKERLETIFDPEEVASLNIIKDALEFTTVEVPESVVNYSGTAAANANNAMRGIIKENKLASAILGLMDKTSRIPVVGGLTSPVTGLGALGASQVQKAAQRETVKNLLNPQKALGTLTIDPRITGALGVSGGIVGQQGGAQ